MNDNDLTCEQKATHNKPSLIKRILKSGAFTPLYSSIMILFAVSFIIYILSRLFTPVAEFVARYPSNWIRSLAASVTSIIPFSLAETLLLLIPVFATAYLIFTFIRIKKRPDIGTVKLLMPVVSIVLVASILFFSMFAPCYFRNSLSDNLGLYRQAVSAEELYSTGAWLCEQLTPLLADIRFAADGESHMPFSYDELVEIMNAAYKTYSSDVSYIKNFYSRPKAVALSEPWTYTHISGAYTFFTGESNININYPDFIVPYTMAHEMAHQRGIAREDEANMVAFLVCMTSDNVYVRYSALTNMLTYVTNALYKANKDLYIVFRRQIYPDQVKAEMNAYSLFFDKYRDNLANTITNSVNNSFLQSQGQTAGVKSYGLVVDLTVAAFKSGMLHNYVK